MDRGTPDGRTPIGTDARQTGDPDAVTVAGSGAVRAERLAGRGHVRPVPGRSRPRSRSRGGSSSPTTGPADRLSAPAATVAAPAPAPASVRPSRHRLPIRRGPAAAPTEHRPRSGHRPSPARPPPPARRRAAGAAQSATETATPLRGAAGRIVANMEASLGVPTATSVRAVPAKLLEVNRTIVNNQLFRTTGGKVSFTHLIGYAVVKALVAVPAMNAAFVADVDGKGTPGVIRHHHVGLGLAVDVEKAGGSRTLLVPCISDADTPGLPRLRERLRGVGAQDPHQQDRPR